MHFAINAAGVIFLAYEILIIIRVVLSWTGPAAGLARNPLVQAVNSITEPLILICREILYSIYRLIGVDARQVPLDFSPILAVAFVHALREMTIALMIKLS